jgi:hypothetical protein
MADETTTQNRSIVTRAEARAQGLKRYFLGKPCPHGHNDERMVSGGCVVCNRLRVLEWQKRNPHKAAERVTRYQKKYPERQRARQNRWASENREKKRARCRKWQQENRDKARASCRNFYYENLDEQRARSKINVLKWIKENPEKASAHRRARKARKRGAQGSYNRADILALMEQQGGICAGHCGKDIRKKFDVDHKTPISRGGSNDPSNLCLMCPMCNRSKHDKTMEEWKESRSWLTAKEHATIDKGDQEGTKGPERGA